MEMETMAMTLIAHSGDARTLAFQALQAAKKHNFEEADRLIGESKKASVLAHKCTDRTFSCRSKWGKIRN